MIEYFICPVCIAIQGYFNILEFILSFTINLFFSVKGDIAFLESFVYIFNLNLI